VDLADFIPNDLDEREAAVIDAIESERTDAKLKRSFFEFVGLKI
jgi:hypothetical protein